MTEETQRALERFAQVDTWHTGHPADMERLYTFIISAHRTGDRVSTEEYLNAFGDLGDHMQEQAMKYYYLYENALELLRQYDNG